MQSRLSTFSGLRNFVHKFDGFIIDQWGVLHNGKVAYDGTIECLQNLKKMNKKIVLLSNSSKRKSDVLNGLEKVGFERQLFDDCVTSGEVAWEMVVSNLIPTIDLSNVEKRNVFVIGNGDDDDEYISSMGCFITPPETATFMLARGTFSILDGVENRRYSSTDLFKKINPWLERGLARDLLLFVSNPDIMRPGCNSPMPGQIGAWYESMGGRVEYVGKPYESVYKKCLLALESGDSIKKRNDNIDGKDRKLSKERICAIGDSLLHDINGAQRAGIVSVWTANGVHSNELKSSEGSAVMSSEVILSSVLEKYIKVYPDYILPCLKW